MAVTPICPALTLGASSAMPDNMPAHIRSWRIRLASVGAGFGTDQHANRINSKWVMTAGALLLRLLLCANGAACWNIPAIATLGDILD